MSRSRSASMLVFASGKMPVEVERDADRRVSHLSLEVLRMRAGGDRERGVRVPQVVEADRADSATAYGRSGDPVTEVVVVEYVPTRRREDESELVRLARDELAPQQPRRPRGEIDLASCLWGALTRFRSGEACADRRVVRPSPCNPRSWFLFWSLCCLVVRGVLQLVLLRPRSQDF